MEIPKYKSVIGNQEQLLKAWNSFKDPEPVTESHMTPDGTVLTRTVNESIHSDALHFWTQYKLPPIPTINGDGAITEHSPVLKSQPSPSSKLEYSVDDTS